jgi:RNA polymerase sigma-70 factor (ECF subfamily)
VSGIGSFSRSIERVVNPVPDDRLTPRDGPASSSPEDDARLIAAVLRGETAAREAFVVRMRCVARMLAVLNSQRGRPLDDEQLADLAQDALVVLWRELAEFRAIASVESWSYGIAYLEFRNACRRCAQSRMRHAQLRDEASRAVDEPSVPEEPGWGDVEEALARLDAEDVAVIRLRHEEELSFDAIGTRLGLPSNTAKTRYHRGLKKLREWLRVRESQEGHPR